MVRSMLNTKRMVLAALLVAMGTGGCIYTDRDRRREVWQRQKEAYNDLWDLFDHYFVEPR